MPAPPGYPELADAPYREVRELELSELVLEQLSASASPFGDSAIFTDGGGRPIPKPELPENPTAEERLAHVRAIHGYNDKVRGASSAAFDVHFRELLKGSK